MTIQKRMVLKIVKGLPDQVDVDELIYRLYLQQKLELAEKDVSQGRLVAHRKVLKAVSKWSK